MSAVRRRPDHPHPIKRAIHTVRNFILAGRVSYLRWLGMDIGAETKISLKARIDKTNPRGIHIGAGTLIAFDATVLSHDLARVLHSDTYIGSNCFIGCRAIILPGVKIGDGCIVAAGSVVTTDIPPGCIIAGNPARVVKSGIRTRKWGMLEEGYQAAMKLYES